MLYRNFIPVLAFLWAASCSENIGANDPAAPLQGKVEVVIGGVQGSTRTSLEGDGRTTRWSVGDKVALWATADEGSTYALTAQPFTLRTYNSVYTSADFASTLDTPMDEGTYTYYAVYPQPASTNGTTATYVLPAVQKGSFDGAYDIMTAAPVVGGGLEGYARDEMQLQFRHMLHMLRIEIPAGKNRLGAPIKKLELEFPAGAIATGTVTFDVTDPERTMSFEGSNKLTVEFEGEGLTETEGAYGYAFVLPGQLNGPITFRAYDAAGYCSATFHSQSISKELLSGRVTPLSVAIAQRRTARLEIVPDWTNLGEAITQIKLKAPAGLSFSDSATEKTVSAQDGKFYADVYYHPTTLANAEFGIDYESENALLTGNKLTLPGSFVENITSTLATTVPYLFEENFDNRSNGESNFDAWNGGASVTGSTMDDTELTGWTGARWKISDKALSVSAYIGSWVFNTNIHSGRVDTRPLPIKSGKSVSVAVSYYVSGDNSSSNGTPQCRFGTTTTTGVINALTGKNNICSPETTIDTYLINNGGSFTNIPESKSSTVPGCTSATRLTWTHNVSTSKNITAKYFYIYLDNIKVKIVH